MSLKRPLEVEVQFVVKPYDTDFVGIVSNIVYIRWLEDLRMAVLDACYPLEAVMAAGLSPVLIETRIQHLRPLRLFDRPLGRMWLSKLGRTSGVLSAEFWAGDHLAAAADQTVCFADAATLRPVEIPSPLRQPYQAWQGQAEAAPDAGIPGPPGA